MSNAIGLSNVLLNLQKELDGLFLEDTFIIHNNKFTLRLLSESETIWTFQFMDPKSTLSLAVAARLANLSIGLRAINGIPIPEVFKETFDSMPEDKRNQLVAEHKEESKIYAALVMDWLSAQPSVFVNELHNVWQDLEERRIEAQDEVKNSLGEDLEKVEKKNLTESSQHGEPLLIDSE